MDYTRIVKIVKVARQYPQLDAHEVADLFELMEVKEAPRPGRQSDRMSTSDIIKSARSYSTARMVHDLTEYLAHSGFTPADWLMSGEALWDMNLELSNAV